MLLSVVQTCLFHIFSIIHVYPLPVHYELTKWPQLACMIMIAHLSGGALHRPWVQFPIKPGFFQAFFRYYLSSVNNCDELKSQNMLLSAVQICLSHIL